MSEPIPHPVQLEQLFFVRCSVIAVPEHAPVAGRVTAAADNKVDVQQLPGEPKRWTFAMKTDVNSAMNKDSPYCIDMECVAFFSVDDTLSEEEARRGVTITGHSVVYGAIREAIAWMTGRQPYGQLLLGLSILTPSKKDDSANLQAPSAAKP